MKKFLTVLLALSVVFTYSFGTVFAVADAPAGTNQRTTAQVNEELTEIATGYKDANAALAETALRTIFGTATKAKLGYSTSTSSIEISKDAVKAEFDKVVKEANDAIDVQLTSKLLTVANRAGKPLFVNFNTTSADVTVTEGAVSLEYYPTYTDLKTFTGAELASTTFLGGLFNATATDGVYMISDSALAVDLSKVAFEAAKAAQQKKISDISLDAYSTTVPADKFHSNYDIANAMKTQTLAKLANLTAEDTWAENVTRVTSVGAFYIEPVGLGDPSGSLYTTEAFGGITGLANVPTKASEAVDDSKLAYAKSAILTDLTSKLNASKTAFLNAQQSIIFSNGMLTTATAAKKVADAKAAIEDANDDFAKALEVITYVVNDAETIAELGTFDTANVFTPDGTKWAYTNVTASIYSDDSIKIATTGAVSVADLVARAKAVADLKEQAELVKQTIAIDGSLAYDVDADLEECIDKAYYGLSASLSGTNYDSALTARKAALKGASATSTVKVNSKTYDAVSKWLPTGSTAFDTEKVDEVKAIISETKDAIKAAATLEAADTAFLAGYAKYDAVPTATEHTALFNVGGALYEKYTKYVKDFKATVASKVATLGSYSTTGDYPSGWNTAVESYYVNSAPANGYFQKGVYTEAQLDAVYAEANAVVADLKTIKTLNSEKSAIQTKALALPTTPTIADKANVAAVQDEIDTFNEYLDKVGIASVTRIANLGQPTTIQKLEADDLMSQYDAIMKDGKVTIDEKAAVEKLRADFDAYVATYQTENTIADLDEAITTANTRLYSERSGGDKDIYNDLEMKIYDLEGTAVAEMIAKLPMTVTSAADAAQVKAAQDAYNALTDEGKAKVGTLGYATKLDAAVKVMEQYKGNLSSLQLKATTKKVGKKVRVYFKVTGETPEGAIIQVYKSKNAVKYSYSKKVAATAKSTLISKTYNGKNYVKYRVVIVNEDGTKTYSAWSIVGCRIIKK